MVKKRAGVISCVPFPRASRRAVLPVVTSHLPCSQANHVANSTDLDDTAAHSWFTLHAQQSPQTFVGKPFPDHKHLRPAYSVNQGRWVYERVFASMQCEDGPSSEVLLSYSKVPTISAVRDEAVVIKGGDKSRTVQEGPSTYYSIVEYI
jgi:hypothetical protein